MLSVCSGRDGVVSHRCTAPCAAFHKSSAAPRVHLWPFRVSKGPGSEQVLSSPTCAIICLFCRVARVSLAASRRLGPRLYQSSPRPRPDHDDHAATSDNLGRVLFCIPWLSHKLRVRLMLTSSREASSGTTVLLLLPPRLCVWPREV